MDKQKIRVIANPSAFMGNAWRWISDLRPIIEEFGGADWSGTVYPTHAMEIARKSAKDGYDLIIAVGGDGTVHEIINGLMEFPFERRPHLGIVPLGSGNDFAHNIGMQNRPELALRQILTGKPLKIDVAHLSDNLGRQEYWNNTMGIGFDGTVAIRTRSISVVRGFMMYLVAVLQTILLNHEAPHLTIVTDLESWEEHKLMLALCNGSREGGGFFVAPDARVDDGWLDYVTIDKVSRLMMLRLIPEVMKGTHTRFPQVKTGKFKKMEIQSDRPLYI
ncbi:MAG: diacylglycerol/lipid kinase family protein, partial [Anaerolineales bacterium]